MINLRGKQLNHEGQGDSGKGKDISSILSAEDLTGGKKGEGETKTPDQIKAEEELALKAKTDLETKTKADEEAARLAKEGIQGAKELELDVDGKVTKYKINAEGNAVDEAGKVIKTKAEIEQIAASQEAPEVTLVEELITNSGFIPVDEKGRPKVYEDTTEGLLQANNDIAEMKFELSQKKFFEANPVLKEVYEAQQRGINPYDYLTKKATAWSNVKFDENNEALQTNIVVESLLKTGMSKENAELTAKMFKDTNQLKAMSKEAHTNMVKFEKEADEKEKTDYQARVKENEVRTKAHWESVNDTIKNGKLHNINIPESERSDFFTFVSKAIDEDGNNQAAIEYSKLTPAQKLELDYIIFKKLDLNKLITVKANTDKVISLRQRVGGDKGLKKGEVDTKTVNPNNVDISINTIN